MTIQQLHATLGVVWPNTVVLVYDDTDNVWRDVAAVQPAPRRVHLASDGVADPCWHPGACWRCDEGLVSVPAVELRVERRHQEGATHGDDAEDRR